MYRAVSGSVAQMRRLEVAMQNLANMNTSGFKGQRVAFGEVLAASQQGADRAGGLVEIAEQRTDFTQGELQQTGNQFDLAIDGEGFFVIDTPRGPRYTRQGTFRLSSDATLVNSFGEPVLGEAGPIRIAGKKMEVSPEGIVRTDAGETGRLRIVRFADPLTLTKEGRGLFRAPAGAAPQPAGEYHVLQGNVEQSNVNAVDALVGLIAIHRQFEAYGKALQMMDSATGKMIAEGARL